MVHTLWRFSCKSEKIWLLMCHQSHLSVPYDQQLTKIASINYVDDARGTSKRHYFLVL